MKLFKKIMWLMLLPLFSKAQNGVYYVPSDKEADSVRAVLANTSNDSLKMFIYYDLSSYYTELNKDSSLYYADLQLQLAKDLQQPLWQADALFQIAYISFGLGNYPKTLNAITNGLSITEDEKSENNNWRIRTFSGDGDAHKARLFILSALHQQFAFLYENVGNIPQAIFHYLEALKIAGTVDNKAESSLDDMSLGNDYTGLHKLDSALILENKARVFAIESNYKIYMGFILQSIGDIYFIKQKYDSAGKYYKDALNAATEQVNLKDLISANLAIAKWFRITGHADSSLLYARKALVTAQSLGVPSGSRMAYNALFSAYKILNNQDSAFVYLQLTKLLGDSLDNIERDKINQYQSLNLNNQIQLQESEKAKIQYQNKIRMYALLAGIGVLMVVAFLLFRNSRNRKKSNDLLQKQKDQIGKQKDDIEQTLIELKATQAQLIQKEKMASLGELTAGIAHEIQNPLNFVNNFSEVNNELVEEIKNENNIDEIKAIAEDIKQNSEKILFHGKRADAIVKGMLQHSRQTKGIKEPTDINALCDEYLRLSYHGLRAKDKNFNADFKTDFDNSIGKINIVPQDIGRVLLNLSNNAFYAVNEKKQLSANSYQPTAEVKTRIINDKVEITVSDNGNGIPQNIFNKIFQPFFTTKPTGEGTGLGLSLSYDIIKAHGGEIKVETKENEGTEFKIYLPAS